jgi:hypothetical protein
MVLEFGGTDDAQFTVEIALNDGIFGRASL